MGVTSDLNKLMPLLQSIVQPLEIVRIVEVDLQPAGIFVLQCDRHLHSQCLGHLSGIFIKLQLILR